MLPLPEEKMKRIRDILAKSKTVEEATEEDRKAMLRNAFIEMLIEMLKEEFEQTSRRPQA